MANAEADVLREAMAVIDVQVAAADRARRHLHDRVAVRQQLRIVHAFAANVARAVVPESFHNVFPCS